MISPVETTHIVLPPHTNSYGNAFGGQIMAWMDIIAGISAGRYCRGPAVTVYVDELQFARPILLGDIVILKAAVNWTGKTSMEVGVKVERESPKTGQREHCLTGYFTFVAIDAEGKPKEITPLDPMLLDEIDLRRYKQAQDRRTHRLGKRIEYK